MEIRENAVIEAIDVVALMNRYPVLAGVTLSVAAGETVLLEGPNGAGKTSFLRACSGLLPVSAGKLTVLDCDSTSQRDLLRQSVGFLGHQNGLYGELSAKENLEFYRRAFRSKTKPVRRTVDECAGLLQLSSRVLEAPVAALSAGQKRRVAIAALLLSDSNLWLLDEPHAGLDAESRDVIDLVIRSTEDITVVFASHERERARQLATRVVGIDGGHVVGDEIFERGKPVYVG